MKKQWLNDLRIEESRCSVEPKHREHLVLSWAKRFQDTGLYKVCLPDHIGGLSLGLVDFMDLTRELAFIDANLAWRFQIANGATYFYQHYPAFIGDSIYASKEVLVSGSGTPSGIGKSVKRGYLVSGSWAYCSGSDLATQVSFVFQVTETGENLAAIVPLTSAVGFQSYSFSGMQYTATARMHFEDLFVPEEGCFRSENTFQGHQLTAFNYPFTVFARAFFIPVLIGSAERYFHELDHYKFISKYYSKVDFNQVLDDFSQLLKSYYACIDFIRQDQYDFFEKEVVQLAIDVNKLMHASLHLAGMEALMTNKPIHYNYQNTIAIAQHYLMNRR